jgi:FKBP-type peptidyl-prolyl cis-trans isomerase 2
MKNAVKPGDAVAVHYTGKLADGSIFDTSRGREPLKMVLGQQRVIPGFEKALVGMTEGETKTASIPASDAYGERQAEMVVQFARENIPEEIDVKIGQELQVQTRAGHSLPARVVDTSESDVTLDANHPLAGQDLMFEIELVEIGAAG